MKLPPELLELSRLATAGPYQHQTDFGQVGSIHLPDGNVLAQVMELRQLDWKRRNLDAQFLAAAANFVRQLASESPRQP